MGAAAWLTLGANFTFETSSFATTKSDETPTVCFQPGGDPSLDDAALALLVNRTAAALAPASRATSSLQLSLAPAAANPDSWEWEDLSASYGALPEPTILNGNVLTVHVSPGASQGVPLVVQAENPADVGAVAIATDRSYTATPHATNVTPVRLEYTIDATTSKVLLELTGGMRLNATPIEMTRAARPPARLFVSHLQRDAAAAGLGAKLSPAARAIELVRSRCDSTAGSSALPPAAPLASIRSAALAQLLNHTLQESDNLYAEAILRAIGGGQPAAGLANVRAALRAVGVALGGLHHVDGSGLSRHNLVPPSLFVALLRAVAHTGLPACFPVGGRSGTLRHRFLGTAAEGRVRAKTGTMSGVSSLSGYLDHRDRAILGELTFSILANNHPDSGGGVLRPNEDAIVVALAEARV